MGETAVNGMLQAVTSAISTVIDWVASVVNALVGSEGALAELLPLFAIGVAISAILLGVKIIRSLIWGA